MQGYVRQAVWSDVAIVASSMRAADVAEIKASNNFTPEEALYGGLLQSAFRGTTMTICKNDGLPVAMLGVVPSGQPDVGIVWLLASDELKNIQTSFLKGSREYLAELTQGYRVVYNYTDARNTLHHRWLQWTGFTILKRHENFGSERRPFLEFCKITEDSYV